MYGSASRLMCTVACRIACSLAVLGSLASSEAVAQPEHALRRPAEHAALLEDVISYLLTSVSASTQPPSVGKQYFDGLEFPFRCMRESEGSRARFSPDCMARVQLIRGDGRAIEAVISILQPVPGVRGVALETESDGGAGLLPLLESKLGRPCKPQHSHTTSPRGDGPSRSLAWVGKEAVLVAILREWPAGGSEDLFVVIAGADAPRPWRSKEFSCDDAD